MNSEHNNPKVHPKQLRVELQKDGLFGSDEVRDCIDSGMLELLKSLDLPESKMGSFSETVSHYRDKLSKTLRNARQELMRQDRQMLESAALELSHNALKIGAVKILRSSFILQNLARCGAFAEASDLVDQIEVEYLKVQQGLENVV